MICGDRAALSIPTPVLTRDPSAEAIELIREIRIFPFRVTQVLRATVGMIAKILMVNSGALLSHQSFRVA
jgi:hypothetical protein